MGGESAGQALLENAYKLSSPDDNSKYYDEFAAHYDADFAAELGYRYPAAIAAAYRARATAIDAPIADIGCGTGLVASALGCPRDQIDGVDISREMLRVAEGKQLYRALYQVDLTTSLDDVRNDYGAVLSAGAFTSGHLGPEPLEDVLQIARADALFVIGVNKAFFQQAGFEPMLGELEGSGRIKDLQMLEAPIYAKPGHDHSNDAALVLTYRKS